MNSEYNYNMSDNTDKPELEVGPQGSGNFSGQPEKEPPQLDAGQEDSLLKKVDEISSDLVAGEKGGSDPLGIRAELERIEKERKKITFKKLFNLIRDKLVDISPSFIINEDLFLEKFRAIVANSLDLSTSAGLLYDRLAAHGLRKPKKEYSHIPKITELPLKAGSIINWVKENRSIFGGKSKRIAATPKLVSQAFRQTDPIRQEFQEEDRLSQVFAQRVSQDGGANTIEEVVNNDLYEDCNVCQADLHVYNKMTGQILDMGQFIPSNYYFSPTQMREIKKEVVKDEKGFPQIKNVAVPKNLNDYQGMRGAPDDFFQNPGGKIGYGNLAEKGGLLSLLHEIAHAWQQKYQDGSNKANFLAFYNQVGQTLEWLEYWEKTIPRILSQEEFEKNELRPALEKLQGLGVEIDPANYIYSGQHLGDNNYRLKFLDTKESGDGYVWFNYEFVISSDKVKPLVEEYAKDERDAWAHAIRVLRYLRKQGFDLEPELKTVKDIQDHIHYALGTYQTSIESKFEPTKGIKKFTVKNLYEKSQQHGHGPELTDEVRAKF